MKAMLQLFTRGAALSLGLGGSLSLSAQSAHLDVKAAAPSLTTKTAHFEVKPVDFKAAAPSLEKLSSEIRKFSNPSSKFNLIELSMRTGSFTKKLYSLGKQTYLFGELSYDLQFRPSEMKSLDFFRKSNDQGRISVGGRHLFAKNFLAGFSVFIQPEYLQAQELSRWNAVSGGGLLEFGYRSFKASARLGFNVENRCSLGKVSLRIPLLFGFRTYVSYDQDDRSAEHNRTNQKFKVLFDLQDVLFNITPDFMYFSSIVEYLSVQLGGSCKAVEKDSKENGLAFCYSINLGKIRSRDLDSASAAFAGVDRINVMGDFFTEKGIFGGSDTSATENQTEGEVVSSKETKEETKVEDNKKADEQQPSSDSKSFITPKASSASHKSNEEA